MPSAAPNPNSSSPETVINYLYCLRTPVRVVRSGKPIIKTVFHLVNWPKFHGRDPLVLVENSPPSESWQRCGRLLLQVGEWLITIVEAGNLSQFLRDVGSKGGYAITHVGEIRKVGDSAYTEDRN